MFAEAIILSIIIGLIRGGSIKRIRIINNSSFWAMLLGIVIQYLLIFLDAIEGNGSVEFALRYYTQIQVFSYILILIGIIFNIRLRSLWALLVGYGLNFISLAFNGWTIPNLIENTSQDVKFPVLGYTIKAFEPYPFPKLLTLGDIIISFGIFALIQEVMIGGSSHSRVYKL